MSSYFARLAHRSGLVRAITGGRGRSRPREPMNNIEQNVEKVVRPSSNFTDSDHAAGNHTELVPKPSPSDGQIDAALDQPMSLRDGTLPTDSVKPVAQVRLGETPNVGPGHASTIFHASSKTDSNQQALLNQSLQDIGSQTTQAPMSLYETDHVTSTTAQQDEASSPVVSKVGVVNGGTVMPKRQASMTAGDKSKTRTVKPLPSEVRSRTDRSGIAASKSEAVFQAQSDNPMTSQTDNDTRHDYAARQLRVVQQGTTAVVRDKSWQPREERTQDRGVEIQIGKIEVEVHQPAAKLNPSPPSPSHRLSGDGGSQPQPGSRLSRFYLRGW